MKKRTSISIVIVVILLLFMAAWWLRRSKPLPEPATLSKSGITNTQTNIAGNAKSQISSSSNIAELVSAYRQGLASKADVMQAVWDDANSKNLDFYGKVIDQNGQPVVGAKVRGGVGVFIDMGRSGGKDYFTETDSQGLFQFIGIRGAGLHIWLEKNGYEHNFMHDWKGVSLAQWEAHDPKNRIICHMWKLKGPEPMMRLSIEGRNRLVPCDGTAVSYNLLTGKQVNDGGDLVVKLTRNPVNIVRGKPFDWSVTLEIPNGGLIKFNDVLYPNEAPADGYQQSVTIDMPSKPGHSNIILDRAFYFKCRNGKNYGRMTIQIHADFQPPPTPLGAEIFVNPSGSRNLEYDRAKEIEPSQVFQRQANQ